MKKILLLLLLCVSIGTYSYATIKKAQNRKVSFLRVSEQNIVKEDGSKHLILGTNLGNWLNPEGYMFGFQKTNAPWKINQMLCELIGPDDAAKFWKEFKENYITEKDIEFIASTGSNTIRLPFHYKLFTDEDYMGLTSQQDGFKIVDKVVEWCRKYNIYLILDMHDAPGGQTGDNIDDSYGYPWLFESETSQKKFCDIWEKIAEHYKNEPVILGYELINEPIAPYFSNMDEMNAKLELLQKRAVQAIRRKDKKHIILLGGAQWNGNFKPFSDWNYDNNIMYTCHRYGGEATKAAIQQIIDFRDKVNLPMYMGEIGHNTDQWQADFCKVMRDNNIGYTFWPYKKVDNSCFMAIKRPEGWQSIIDYSEKARITFKDIRDARPDQGVTKELLKKFIENSRFENCLVQDSYIKSLNINTDNN